ncbi:glycoside hydrolase family 9 protein [Chondrinema litorale]|uniref:glycoside hydrolase family 9 protein n=1 Tax=Chondrinema litorale TaxID=2994555 RepID=UPI0025428729|nr:glycoside hydrolase family 9 protein [Chondrinema litorale]UZR96123.1 glycoside hydrolase family 9 protein [Chondrinema litorale]
MHKIIKKTLATFLLLQLSYYLFAQDVKVLTNHIGYDQSRSKKAVVIAEEKLPVDNFLLIDENTGKTVYNGKVTFNGAVDKWKNWQFWEMDFSDFKNAGKYRIQISFNQQVVNSFPFDIEANLIEKLTLSDVVYYFKGQRSSGLFDKADKHLVIPETGDTVDVHGGWYDATGDYGKHLSHLSFSTYFNPQQITISAWSMFKAYEYLKKADGKDFRQSSRRLIDEAMYGADFLVRMHVADGSFYRSVGAPGPGKLAKDRVVRPESEGYSIKKSKDQSFHEEKKEANKLLSYQVSYRSGGGIAIAALAMASTYDISGDFTNKEYLVAAEEAFIYLEKENLVMTNNGVENILDDYCALNAATELYKATKKEKYKQAADKRANSLMSRLSSWKTYKDFWRADEKDRPFFHPSDAGLPVMSLMYYTEIADNATQNIIKEVVKKSLEFELAVTLEVNNPFGYSRQLVQDTLGNRRTSFFFPHGSDAAPWWQGENARLSSMAAAARMAANYFSEDKPFAQKLNAFAQNQLNWVLGLNPYDACMLHGKGHNNPEYGFFGTYEYKTAPGGIVNGITAGFNDEHDIDFNLSYAKTGMDNDWRWAEQWLPHAAWYLLAVATP